MSYTKTVYDRVPLGYNDNMNILSCKVFDCLILDQMPDCLSWCGSEIIGPYEPDEEEARELETYPGFSELCSRAWEKFCSMSDDELARYCAEHDIDYRPEDLP